MERTQIGGNRILLLLLFLIISMWYQFDPEQGDVELGKLRLAASSGGVYKCTFTLGDGNKFTVECTSLFQALSEGTLTFEDCTKEYCDNVEYYYSKY